MWQRSVKVLGRGRILTKGEDFDGGGFGLGRAVAEEPLAADALKAFFVTGD